MRVRVFVGLVTAVLTPFTLIGCHGSDSNAPIPFWSSVSSGTAQNLWSVWGTSASDVWAVGDNATILHYDGTSWSTISAGTITPPFYSIWGASPSDVWAVGGDFGGGVIVHYDGVRWSSVSVPSGAKDLRSVWGTSASDVWAVRGGTTGGGTTGAAILHYDGTTWSGVSSPTVNSGALGLSSVWGTSASDVWAVGTYYYTSQSAFGLVIFHYDGTSWSSPVSGAIATNPFFGIWGSSPSNIWALGGSYDSGGPVGTILHYDGTSWSSVSNALMANLRAIGGTSASDVWSVGDAILHYDGTSWSSAPSGTSVRLLGVWGASASDVWAVGEAGTILHGSPPR
jgi:hypothetical protein